MRIRTTRKAIYAVTALTVLALVGGFAAASVGLGQTNVSYQGSQTTTIASVPGLNWTSTTLVELGSKVVNTTCSAGSPCGVSSASATDCVGGVTGHTGCLQGDFVEQVTLTTTHGVAFPGTLKITLYVTTASGVFTGPTFDYTQASTSNSVETIVQDFDAGSSTTGPSPVMAVSVIITT